MPGLDTSGKKAVLIHGCHLQADLNGQTWEGLVWGLVDGKPTLSGRATMGIKIALMDGAERVVFSTGASERDGLKEGEYTYQWALKHARDLSKLLGVSASYLRGYLRRVSVLDLESQNTAQECTRNFTSAVADGFETITLVSSPWHVQRCLTEALKAVETMRAEGKTIPRIKAEASYGSTEGIVILEPSHRGDQPKTNWAIILRGVFGIKEDKRVQAESDIAAIIAAARL